MPFTLSHAAVVVPAYRPLARMHLLSAAAIGSMSPDFGLLLPESLARWQTHSLQALFTFCLPGGLIAWWLTHRLVKPAVLELLPDGPWARARAQHSPVAGASMHTWSAVAVAILLGAFSHLVLDAFTHEDARGVRLFTLLDDYRPAIAGHTLRLYAWLQYGSSVAGLAVLLLAAWLWLRHAPAPVPAPQRRLARTERIGWSWMYTLLPLLAVAWSIVRSSLVSHLPWFTAWVINHDAVVFLRREALGVLALSAVLRLRLRLLLPD